MSWKHSPAVLNPPKNSQDSIFQMFRKLVRNHREHATLTQFIERERAVPRVLLKHLRADVQEAHFPNRVSTSPQREQR